MNLTNYFILCFLILAGKLHNVKSNVNDEHQFNALKGNPGRARRAVTSPPHLQQAPAPTSTITNRAPASPPQVTISGSNGNGSAGNDTIIFNYTALIHASSVSNAILSTSQAQEILHCLTLILGNRSIINETINFNTTNPENAEEDVVTDNPTVSPTTARTLSSTTASTTEKSSQSTQPSTQISDCTPDVNPGSIWDSVKTNILVLILGILLGQLPLIYIKCKNRIATASKEDKDVKTGGNVYCYKNQVYNNFYKDFNDTKEEEGNPNLGITTGNKGAGVDDTTKADPPESKSNEH